ncbi:MAG: rhombotarget lipoprotein, partial [Gammaproteobacteria bacterium]
MARIPITIILGCVLALTGCTRLWHNVYETQTEHTVSSSLVDYLYPGEAPVASTTAQAGTTATVVKKTTTPGFWSNTYAASNQPASTDYAPSPSQAPAPRHVSGDLPELHLPLTIGIAFIPTKGEIPGLSEARKAVLLQRLKQQMAQYRFIDHIQIIPEMYFRRGRGFDHVAKVGRRHHVDAIALVSYDQVVHMDDNNLSFLYLTVVGAYLVSGSQYDTQTFVDAAVIDVNSKQILFRIPGVDDSLTNTTLMGSVREKRQARYQSFETAFDNMIGQVDDEVRYFKRRYSNNSGNNAQPQDASKDEATTGGGASDWFAMTLLLLLLVFRRYGKPVRQFHQ